MTENPEPPISYEQARAELREIVQALESGGQPLEQSLALWQRGEELAALCQRWLDGARVRLDAAIEATDEATASGSNASSGNNAATVDQQAAPATTTRGKR